MKCMQIINSKQQSSLIYRPNKVLLDIKMLCAGDFFELLDNKRNVIFITFAPRIRLKQVGKQ